MLVDYTKPLYDLTCKFMYPKRVPYTVVQSSEFRHDPVLVKEEGLLKAVMSVNDRLKTTNLHYESYLGTAGRHMFYQVALGYTTIYLAVIFLIIANTLIGVQFLIQQEKTGAGQPGNNA